MSKSTPGPDPEAAYIYSFPALRGVQAGREFFVAMCPLKLVPKIFSFDGGDVPDELRAQRVLNRARIPEIAHYLVANPRDYVFSSISASVDKRVQFTPIGKGKTPSQLGQLVIPMTARILINDGQHRRAAIEEALQHRPELGEETLSVVFFQDAGLKRSQQMFADLNKHAVRPSRSLGILYDHRDPFALLAKNLVDRVPLFKGLTEVGKTTISNRSRKLFTLSTIFQATVALLGGEDRKEPPTPKDESLAIEYWGEMPNHIPEWKLAIDGKVSCGELRQDFIHAHGIALHALGRAGAGLLERYPSNWKTRLSRLDGLDWRRTNASLWEGRALMGGHASKAPMNIVLTANVLKAILGLPLTASEQHVEDSFHGGVIGRASA